MKNKVFILFACALLAAACDSTGQAQQHQALTQQCADQAQKSPMAQATNVSNVQNHYNQHLGKCFVLIKSGADGAGSYYQDTSIYDAYENKLYFDCFTSWDSSLPANSQTTQRCEDHAGSTSQDVPIDQEQKFIDSYMNN